MLLLLEKVVGREVTKHYLYFFEAERIFLIRSENEFIIAKELELLGHSFTHWLECEALGPLKQFALMKEEYNQLQVLLLVSLPALSSDKEV